MKMSRTVIGKLAIGFAAILAVSVAEARIVRQDRVLVVVSELQTHGPQNLKQIYAASEEATWRGTEAVLGDDYQEIYYLRGAQATLNNFTSTLRSLSRSPGIRAIDVIFSLHGSPEGVAFREGGVRMSTVRDQLLRVTPGFSQLAVNSMKTKLRMMYNLSCFGRTHNNEFRQMGFDVTVGSIGINANAEVEFPSVVGFWSLGWRFADTFNATNNDIALAVADTPVRLSGIDANSKKVFLGATGITIDSDPL